MILTEAQFVATMRTGADFHTGSTETMLVMPWLNYRWMSLYDLQSMYLYLQAIPAVSNATPTPIKTTTVAPAPTLPSSPRPTRPVTKVAEERPCHRRPRRRDRIRPPRCPTRASFSAGWR